MYGNLYDYIDELFRLQADPKYMMYMDKIERVRQTLLCEDNADRWRNVRTTYIWGLTGTGKTRTVMETYGYRKVYRVTDYDHPFDSYKGQDVIVFDEFRSSLQMTQMLDYLDGYPVELKARYCNKQALEESVTPRMLGLYDQIERSRNSQNRQQYQNNNTVNNQQ